MRQLILNWYEQGKSELSEFEGGEDIDRKEGIIVIVDCDPGGFCTDY